MMTSEDNIRSRMGSRTTLPEMFADERWLHFGIDEEATAADGDIRLVRFMHGSSRGVLDH